MEHERTFEAEENRERGFTLMETLAALALLSLSMSVIAPALIGNLRNNLRMQVRYEAVQAAQHVIDELRFTDVSGATAPYLEDVVVDGRTYNVVASYCSNPAFCLSTDVRHISVQVTYNADIVYRTDTVFSKFR